ncbi:MAG: hypothetical protein DRR42_24635 [Gammaproteobacteria bacterium]|nr:MAG: hypothetical protein DRR42_24635 [Gammaproteobacteria bacterium]
MIKPTRLQPFFAAAILAALLFSSSTIFAVDDFEPIEPSEPIRVLKAPSKSLPALKNNASRDQPSLIIDLGKFNQKDRKKGDGGGLQIGNGRDMPSAYNTNLIPLLDWKPSYDKGRTARLTIHSTRAAALRLGVNMVGLPDGIELRFYGVKNSDEIFGPYMQVDYKKAESPLLWSPTITGDTIGVEIYIPPTIKPTDDISLYIPKISHLDVSPSSLGDDGSLEVISPGGSDTCTIDVQCATTMANDLKNSVAHIEYTNNNGDPYICTGTLLNDRASSNSGYFMTAHHCIGTAAEAGSIITHWFYETSSCNSGILSPAYTQLVSGATLLVTGVDTDFTLLQLRDFAPIGAVQAGSSQSLVEFGSFLEGIHHPLGDFKKWSFGEVEYFYDLTRGVIDPNADYISIAPIYGATEGGSSGSAIFDENGYFRGQLWGNIGSCSSNERHEYYGRYDLTFPHVKPWLYEVPEEITNNTSITDTVNQGEFKEYKVVFPANETEVEVELSGLTANADLVVRKGRRPNNVTAWDSDCKSLSSGTAEEKCTLPNSGENTYYIGVINFGATTNFTLTVGDKPSFGQFNPEIIISPDGPIGQVTGGSTVVGWAIAPAGINYMGLFIDDEFYSFIPMGSLRRDVGSNFPEYPGSNESGYSLYIPLFVLPEGEHVLDIIAFDNNGDWNALSITINTTVFDGIWSPASEVDLSNIRGTYTRDSVVYRNVNVQGVNHTIALEWDFVLQGLAIKTIRK